MDKKLGGKMGITHRENLSDCKDRIVFTFDRDKVTEVVDEIAALVAKDNKIKGFRKGKAPIHAVKSVAKKFILQNAGQKLANDAFADILYETKIKPFGPPQIVKIDTTYNSFTIDMNLSYYPNFDLTNYKDFKLTEPTDLPEKEAMIEKAIENLKKQYPNLRVFEADEFVMDGDSVIVDYIGTINNEEFNNNKSEGVPIDIGSENIMRDFEVNMFGMKVGETREFDVDFPEGGEKLSGKTVTFKVTLNSGVKKDLPELDDELAKKVGFDSVDAIMKVINEQSLQAIENTKKQQLKVQVIDKLLESNTIAIPTWMLGETAKSIAKNHGVDFEKAEEAVREKLLEDSEKVLKLNMILGKIREKEPETELSNEEIMNIIKVNANKFPADVQSALQNKDTSQAMMAKLFSEIQDEQVFAWVTDHSTVVENVEKDVENAPTEEK